ncbi:transcriptional regulator, partial [Klebsiella pneumoniae]|nr:transcriptional regulator [Klebsiella pneumoniae]
MIKRAICIFAPVVLLAGCSGNVQNPVDRITFRDEPLVR